MEKSVKKNYIYNLTYQIFLIIVPVIVTPYVARVLGEDGTGIYSFAFSLVTYFILFASLGFDLYSQRNVAKYQDNKKEQSRIFWGIFFARLISVFFVLIIYITLLFIGVYDEKYRQLMWIFSINIVATAFDISYFFQGNEDFKSIVFYNIIIRLVSIVLIFLLVKKSDDLYIYAIISSGTTLLANFVLWIKLPKAICKVSLSTIKPLQHLLPSLLLFLPTIAASVYTSLDKTMIGLITGLDSENGNYEYAEKIVKMVLTVLTSLGAVFIPKNSRKFKDGDISAVAKNIIISTRFVCCLAVPFMFGLIAVADNFIPWFLGDGYPKVAILIKILSPILLFIGLSNVFGLQYLIPTEKDKKFFIAITSGAVVNVLLNSFLIYYFQSYGAAIATVIAEFVVMVVMLVFVKKDVNIISVFKSVWKYFIAGIIMFVPCLILNEILVSSIINTFIIIFCGVIVYLTVIILLKDDFVLDEIKKLLAKIKVKNK